MKIGVDFDRVLFKTDDFNKHLKQEVEGLEHVDSSPTNDHGVYSPEIHAELCGIDVEEIYKVMENLEKFLYDDLDVLQSSEHEILIVSRGETEFQKRKIEGSGADEYADRVVVVEKGSKEVEDIDFLIDDRKKELEDADLPGFEFDREIHSLRDALEEAEKHEA
ncbi:hypothetical protein [Candidatus Nanohalobium constans]|uniref:Uncharacterized protein n=1 Tax=Candidatus Nanohalobium constans TaxID=2565781 RepID=A0A5Q0UHA1_9ARCH|nr:hypothetical protein [Candidatus Nanohalobium constans]QGA81018.1 hypothetical protein LC1Nh_1151 [Candidatus Nanohalobium constans]